MYVAFAWCETSLAAAPQMVVVRAYDDCLILQDRIRAVQDSYDVVSRNAAPRDVRSDAERQVFERHGNILSLRRRTWLKQCFDKRLRGLLDFSNGRESSRFKDALRGLTRDDHDGQASLARAIVIAKPGEPIILEILFACDDDERRSTLFARGNRLPTHVCILSEMSVRVVAIGCALESDCYATLYGRVRVIVVIYPVNLDAIPHECRPSIRHIRVRRKP